MGEGCNGGLLVGGNVCMYLDAGALIFGCATL